MQKEKLNLKAKKKYKKKNEFRINFFFDENGATLENIMERAFENYVLKNG